MKTWKKINSKFAIDLGIFKARFDFLLNPRNNKELKATVLEAQDAVNIVAITADSQILFIKQYRFGVEEKTLEIPGGFIEKDEIPLHAAKRELREETGYSSAHWEHLGEIYANPVFMNSKIHHFAAFDVERTSDKDLDEGEDIEMLLMTMEGFKKAIKNQEIKNPHSISALSRIFNLYEAKSL